MGAAPDGVGYTGHVNDPETGLVYMQARYYDSAVGRFLSVDPVDPQAGNVFNIGRYEYANNSPIVNIDPDGRVSWGDVKSLLLPTTLQLASRGVPGGAKDNVVGALKQIGNQAMAAAALASGNPMMLSNAPKIPIANSELAGASAVEVGSAVVGAVAGLGGRAADATPVIGEAFHYTFSKSVSSIEANGLRQGAFATDSGGLSPLQAHVDLALPPNRGLPDVH